MMNFPRHLACAQLAARCRRILLPRTRRVHNFVPSWVAWDDRHAIVDQSVDIDKPAANIPAGAVPSIPVDDAYYYNPFVLLLPNCPAMVYAH